MAATGPGANFGVNIVGEIIRADVVSYFATLSQVGMYSNHYRVSAVTGAGTTLGAIASQLDVLFRALTKAVLASNATYRGVVARMIWPAPPSPPAIESANFGPGLVAGDAMALQVAGVISLYTQFAGRAYRGRRYIPFPSETDNGPNGIPTAGYLAGLDAIKNQLLQTLTVGAADSVTLVPCLFHRRDNSTNDLRGGLSRTGWGTQRRRSYFGRQNPQPF